MELPPSPPVHNDYLLKRELDKRERANLAPSSRSLIWGGLSSSLPPNMMMHGGPSTSLLASSFSGKAPLDSLREDTTAEMDEMPIERKTSTSLSEPNTIYSMMRSNSISGPSSPPTTGGPASAGLPVGIGAAAAVGRSRIPPPALRPTASVSTVVPQPVDGPDAGDEIQFSLSLDPQDESFMMDEDGAGDDDFMQPYGHHA